MVNNLPDSSVSLDQIETCFRRFLEEDDVFSMHFTRGAGIYVQNASDVAPATPTPALSQTLVTYLEKRSARLLFLNSSAEFPTLPERPYFITQNQLYQA